jgi:large subunit ribosomal protein L10
MAITKEKKQEIVKQLAQLFENAKSVVFSDYRGLSVKDFNDLRSKLRNEDVDYKVAKKTLIKIAADKAGFKDIPEDVLSGQIGLAFSKDDEIIAAKTLYEFSKDNDSLQLLGALMEGDIIEQEKTLELAKIPSKDELLAKLVGSIQAPVSGFHSSLHSLLRNFVGVMASYKDKVEKEGPKEEAKAEEEPKEAPKEEAKAEEEPKEAPKEEPKEEKSEEK